MNPHWEENSDYYQVQLGDLELTAEKDRLVQGVTIACQGQPWLQVFALDNSRWTETAGQSYIRNNDLVGFFEADHNITDCYWRLVSSEICDLALEGIFSIRSSQLTLGEIALQVQVSCLGSASCSDSVFQDSNQNWFGKLLVHPTDMENVVLKENARTERIAIFLFRKWSEESFAEFEFV